MKRILTLGVLLMIFCLTSTAHADFTKLQLSATTTPSVSAPGTDGYIELKITNAGVTTSNQLKLVSVRVDSPIVIQPLAMYLGYVESGKSLSILAKFSVPTTTPSGFYMVYFTVDDCDNSICRSYTTTGVITVQTAPSVEISVSPNEFKPGQVCQMNFSIINKGSKISDFVMEFQSDALIPLGQNNRIFIPSIDAGEQITTSIPLSISPTVASGVYALNIVANYKDQTGNSRNITAQLGYIIKGDIKLLSMLDSQDLLSPRSRGTATIKISNAGHDIKFLWMRVTTPTGITASPGEVYIGNLKSDDYDTEKINLQIGNVSTGIYKLGIELSYQDVFGQSYNEKREIPIVVSSPAERPDGYFIFAIVIIIIIAFLFRIRKR